MKKRMLFSTIVCGVCLASAIVGTSFTTAASSTVVPTLGQCESEESAKTTSTATTNAEVEKKPSITGTKIVLEDPKLKEGKSWVEYIDYSTLGTSILYLNEKNEECKIEYFDPINYVDASVMSVEEYKPNIEPGKTTSVDWSDLGPVIAGALAGGATSALHTGLNPHSLISGGIFLGFAGGAVVGMFQNAPYYGNQFYTGISNENYCSMDSITISIQNSKGFQVEKSKALDIKVSNDASTNMTTGIDVYGVKLGVGITEKTQTSLGYGVNFGESTSGDTGVSISRTFQKREDEFVKNTPWKLVEYTAKIPLKVKDYQKVGTEWVFCGENFISINLMKGIVREFANGYIEHWNTGELVFRADFFEKFLTKDQIINNKKNKIFDDAFKK